MKKYIPYQKRSKSAKRKTDSANRIALPRPTGAHKSAKDLTPASKGVRRAELKRMRGPIRFDD